MHRTEGSSSTTRASLAWRRGSLLLCLAAGLSGLGACADESIPVRPKDELVREGRVFIDPETHAPYTGAIIATFEDRPEVVAERLYVRDGTPEGPYEAYFANRNLSAKEVFRAGVRHGPYEWYFESGRLYEAGTYRRGRLDGPYRAYWDGADIEETGTYRGGAFDGPRAWYVDGHLVERVTYQDGAMIGPYERYAPDGSLELRGILSDGRPCGVWLHGATRVDHGACEAEAQ